METANAEQSPSDRQRSGGVIGLIVLLLFGFMISTEPVPGAALERARQPDLPEIDHFAPCKSTAPERRGSFRTVLADSGLASRLHHDR